MRAKHPVRVVSRPPARLWGLVLGLPLLAQATCVETGSPLVVLQAQIPETGMNSCDVPADRTVPGMPQGVLDVGLRDRARPYRLFPQILNSLAGLASAAGGAEPNRVDVTRVSVRVEPPPGLSIKWPADCPISFDWATPLTLFPGEESPVVVEALRACHAATIAQAFKDNKLDSNVATDIRFRVIVRAKGRHGGSEITSDPFEFPIRVCFGCLQTGFNDAQYSGFSVSVLPACSRLLANPYQGNPCNPAQDFGPVLCCARDNDGGIECPGIPRAMSMPTTPAP